MTAARMRASTPVRYSVDVGPRICFLGAIMLCTATVASAQTYAADRPPRHFVTLSYDFLYTQPLHFADHPLSDLLGTDVASAQGEVYEYRTRDGSTSIDVVEFRRRSRGAGVSLYPLGLST